nr:hypothetical protein [Tanacetum cinerariifolium]
MNEAVKAAIQLQSDRLRDEAKAENEDFINKIDENIKKIIKEQVKVQVKEQVSKILSRIEKSVNEILKAEVLIHTVTLKIHRDDENEDDEPFAGLNRGSKRTKARKEHESTSAPKDKTSKSTGSSKEGSKSKQEEQVHMIKDLEEPAPQKFETSFTKDHPVDETTQLPDWFQKPSKPPTHDRAWNKTLPVVYGPIQPWISTLAWKEDPRDSFNGLMDTPLDFSAFMMNRLKVDTLTPELLADPTFELIKGSCKSLMELEYFLEEVYKATTDQLDWNTLKGSNVYMICASPCH